MPQDNPHTILKNKMIAVARAGKTIAYMDLGISRKNIGAKVGAVGDEEIKLGHPRLSVIVVRKDTGYPSGGIFGFGVSEDMLRRPDQYDDPLTKANKLYIIAEQKKVWVYWSTH